jgi:hypothetical protein
MMKVKRLFLMHFPVNKTVMKESCEEIIMNLIETEVVALKQNLGQNVGLIRRYLCPQRGVRYYPLNSKFMIIYTSETEYDDT